MKSPVSLTTSVHDVPVTVTISESIDDTGMPVVVVNVETVVDVALSINGHKV